MTAILVLGVSTTAFANAEEYIVNVDGNHQYWIDIQVVKGDTVTFVNTHDGDNQSLEPHCISDPYAVPYTEESCWIIDGSTPSRSYTMTETQTFYDRFFDVPPITVTVVEKQSNTGDGTMEAHVYGIPFDVKIMEGGKVVYHNNDPMFHHDLQHTGTVGTEKGGTFSMWAGSNGGTATANFPVENCSSCYPAGVYSWKDSVSGITGTITILAGENTVNEQVGIQEDIVVVLKKSESIIQSNSTETADSVLDKTKNFKTQIEAKINAKIEPLKTEISLFQLQIVNLKEELANNENDRLILDEQKEKLTKQINLLRQNATISETKYLEESKINKDLRGKISTLESQAVDTIELEKYRKDAANWKGVALEQLRVMGEILGLF